jgi:hypothetical protein
MLKWCVARIKDEHTPRWHAINMTAAAIQENKLTRAKECTGYCSSLSEKVSWGEALLLCSSRAALPGRRKEFKSLSDEQTN